MRKAMQLSIRWLCYEIMGPPPKCASEKSDVWSFGVRVPRAPFPPLSCILLPSSATRHRRARARRASLLPSRSAPTATIYTPDNPSRCDYRSHGPADVPARLPWLRSLGFGVTGDALGDVLVLQAASFPPVGTPASQATANRPASLATGGLPSFWFYLRCPCAHVPASTS